jgi:hypothetical protein
MKAVTVLGNVALSILPAILCTRRRLDVFSVRSERSKERLTQLGVRFFEASGRASNPGLT